jgi:hypothetical protein
MGTGAQPAPGGGWQSSGTINRAAAMDCSGDCPSLQQPAAVAGQPADPSSGPCSNPTLDQYLCHVIRYILKVQGEAANVHTEMQKMSWVGFLGKWNL